jgi:DNA polymerase alpha subunit A
MELRNPKGNNSNREIFKRLRNRNLKKEFKTTEGIYDEVTEEEYSRIVQDRINDNFVVDDDGSGYVDHGLDEYDDDFYESSDEEQYRSKKKRRREEKPESNKNIKHMFLKQNSKPSKKRPTSSNNNVDDDAFFKFIAR